MTLDDFDFNLPDNLIAQYPAKNRVDSKLLISDGLIDDTFSNISNYLNQGDLLVFNDTKVIPARLFAHKESGGKVEVMLDRIIAEDMAIAMIRASRAPKIGSKIIFDDNHYAIVLEKNSAFFKLKFNSKVLDLSEKSGHIPLPPYIKRQSDENDKKRYQSIFAKNKGAVAAPTASLHFDNKLLVELQNKGIDLAYLTLHVGSGTFAPVKTDNILEHKMHCEYFNISSEVINKIQQTKKNGGRVIAVGTTVVRVLESIGKDKLKATSGETNIFIYPGFKFRVVDSLITNFHIPKSTLLMLVSAFAGRDNIINTYQHAINNSYRFFSYGDSMLLNLAKF